MWEDQRIVARPRYRDLIAALRFVARQEIIFGLHVHVGVDDPDKAIHVANGMRVHIPVLLALSANSPFWRAEHRPRVHPHADLPRVPARRHPAAYRDWEDFSAQIEFMVAQRRDRGLHLPLVRRPPASQVRHRRDAHVDAQTRVEHTLGARRPDPGDGQGAGRALRLRQQLSDYPWQMLDENKWLAARHGLDAELVDLPSAESASAPGRWPSDSSTACAPTPRTRLAGELEGIEDLLDRGNGAARQKLVYEANHDFARGHAPRSCGHGEGFDGPG